MTYFKNFNKLFFYEKVIISSPNHTHEKYLERLINFKGEILCEKPAISKSEKNLILKRYLKKKRCNLTINYNFLYSDFVKYLSIFLKNKKYGKKISLFITKSNSLSLDKKKYLGGWRANKKLTKGIAEIQTIHFVNMLLHLFRKLKLKNKIKSRFSSYKNTPIDTLNYSYLNKDFFINIFNSYATVYEIKFELFSSKAKLIYDGKEIKIFFPSNTKDKDGRFTHPILVNKKRLNFEKDWKNSLAKSINNFANKKISNYKQKLNLTKAIETLSLI